MEDKRKILYNQLSKDYDLGDFDSFSAKLDDETKRKAFYDAVSKDYDLGDYNSFVTKISASKQPEMVEVANKPSESIETSANEKPNSYGDAAQTTNVNWSNPTHDWKTDEQKTIEEIARSGNATIAKDEQGNEYYPVKPMEVAFDEGLQQEKKRIQALATVGEQLDNRIKANEEALKEAYDKRESSMNRGNSFVFGAGASSAPKVNTDAYDETIKNLIAEQDYLTNSKKLYEAAKNDAGFFSGMKDAVDASFLTFGVSDLHNAERISNVQRKLESGQPLSESEQSLLTSLGLQQVVNERYNDLLGSWYKAGMTTADMVPFMAEMAVNPLSGLGKSAMKASVKKFGEKGVKAVTTKILSRAIGDAAGAAGMAVTTGMPSVMADALERQQGYVTTDTSSGVVEGVGLDGGESASDAWRKAITSRTIENWSEMVGNYFAPIGKTAGKITAKTLNALKLGKVNEIIDNINSSNLARILDDFTEQTQWNGSLGEFAEEQVGMIADALLVGDTKWSDITDLDQQLDVALGVGVFGSFMSLLRIGGYRTPKYRARKAVERADKDGLNVFGSEWEGIKELILASPDEELSANLAAHTEFSTEQMKAALMYANALKAQQAVNTYKEKEKIDKPSDVGVETEFAYDEGFETTENYLKHYAKRELDFAESELGVTSENSDEQQFAQMVMAGADSPVESINAMAEKGYSDEQIQKAKDYYTAYHRMNGITDALLEDVDSQIERADNEVDANTNQDNGSVTRVVLRNGGVGHVVEGTVVRAEDGTVDVNNSDDVIFVRLENGETKMMNPNKDLVGVAWMNSPERLKEYNNTILKQYLLDKAIGEIDWNPTTPNPKVGDSFEMNGVPLVVAGMNENGLVVVSAEEWQKAQGKKDYAFQTQSVVPVSAYKDWASAQLDAQEQTAVAQQEAAIPSVPVSEEVNTEVNNPVEEVAQPQEEVQPVVEEAPAIPTKEDGSIDFVSYGKEGTFKILGEKYGEKMPHKIEVTAKALAEDLRKAQQKLDKAELDYDDAPIGREDKAEKALNKAREEFEAVKREADFWAEMDAEIKSAQVMPGDEAADEILSMEEPLNGLEFAAQMLANGNIKLLQESFMEETGFGREESKKYFGLFASKEKGGVSVERAGERLMEADREEGTNFFDQNDANAGRDAIIEILGIAQTKSDLANYIKDNREKQARKEQAAEYAVYESWVEDNFHMSVQDYEAYEEVIDRELSERALTEEEYQEFMSTFVDETINNEQYEQQGIDSESEGSSEILPGTQSLQAERTGGIEEESAEVDGGIVGENGALPEGASERVNVQDDDWTEEGKYGETYKRTIIIDGIHHVIQVDEANKNGDYTGSYFLLDGKRFAGIPEVLEYIDDNGAVEKPQEVLDSIKQARSEVDTNPTDAQKEAGNYKKGHVKIDGFDITIENPKGGVRSGTDKNGKKWSITMNNDYGYIRGTEAVDGDHIDVFLSDNPTEGNVFVVDQSNEDGSFDESKVMYGFSSLEEARAAYLSNYEKGWESRIMAITEVSKDEFKKWIDSSHRKTKAFSEYKSVKAEAGQGHASVEITFESVKNLIDDYYKEDSNRVSGTLLADEHREAEENMDRIESDLRGMVKSLNDDTLGKSLDYAESLLQKSRKKVLKADMDFITRIFRDEYIDRGLTAKEQKPYTIQPATYTTKKGKVLDMFLVKPTKDEMSRERQSEARFWVKEMKGWYDRKEGGWMLRSKEDADKFAEKIFGEMPSESYDLITMKNVTDGDVTFSEPVKEDEYSPTWQYIVSVDKESGFTTLRRDDVSGIIPIGDARFTISATSPQEMLDILRNPLNGMQEVLDAVGVTLENKIKTREMDAVIDEKRNQVASGNKLVSDERYAELRERMRKKLGGQMNIGIDPEILAIGTEMAVYHIEKGARKFAEYAKAMIADLGDAIRPYLKAFYNGARDLPEMQSEGLTNEMTSYDEVSLFDVANFDKPGTDAVAAAETIVKEEQVEQQTQIAKERIKKQSKPKKKTKENVSLLGDLFNQNTEDNETGTNEQRGNLSPKRDSNENREMGSEAREEGSGTSVRRETGSLSGYHVSDETGSGRVHGVSRQSSVKNNTRNFSFGEGHINVPSGDIAKLKANIEAIRTLKEIEASGQPATDAQKTILSKYVGWGGLSAALDEQKFIYSKGWQADRNWNEKYLPYYTQLRELLTKEEFNDAVQSTLTSHYTPEEIIRGMWNVVERMGFKGGRINEPAAGVGHIIGMMPTSISERSIISGTELDSLSGRIAKVLYPDANIKVQGYEKEFSPKSKDLVITNVPFGKTAPYDKVLDKALHKKMGSAYNLHNYFIAKGLLELKEGGIGVFVTSSATMDGANSKFREWVAANGIDLIGAIRLPNNAFLKNAGTSVTADMLVFRKRKQGETCNGINFVSTTQFGEGQYIEAGVIHTIPIMVNEYFAEHPDMILGTMMTAHDAGSGGLYSGSSQTCVADKGANLAEDLGNAIMRLDAIDVDLSESQNSVEQQNDVQTTDLKNGTLVVQGDNVLVSINGELQPVESVEKKKVFTFNGKKQKVADAVRDYNALKETLKSLIQAEQSSDINPEPIRKKLNKQYDDFVSKYGTLNRNKALDDVFAEDFEHNLPLSLESVKRVPSVTGKSMVWEVTKGKGILEKRVSYPVQEPTHAESVEDAIRISQSYRGVIDVPYVASLVDRSELDVITEMLQEGLAYREPITGNLVDKETYLSGNVKEKLEQARAMAEEYPEEYQVNVDALAEVQPETVRFGDISYRIGTPWIPEQYINDFALDVLGIRSVDVKYVPSINEFVVSKYARVDDFAKSGQFRTERVGVIDLLEYALNQRKPKIVDKKVSYGPMGKVEERIPNEAETQAAAERIMEISDKFVEYIDGRSEIHRELERIYNDKYNNYRLKQYELPAFEHYPNSNTEITLREHQKKAVQRSLSESTLLAHQVGTGKTFTMITTAMEMRRLGIAKKPMIVVQNATLEDFVKDFYKLYPGANVLAPGKDERSAEKRKRLFNLIATGDFDAIVIPQSFMQFIPDDEGRKEELIEKRIEEYENVLESIDDYSIRQRMEKEINALRDILEGRETGNKKKRSVKDSAKVKESIKVKVEKTLDRRTDEVLTFEQMGIDALFIDEAHNYKKIGFASKMSNVKGVDTSASQRANSLLLKAQYVQEKNGGRNVILATGTPITNTMAEVWTMMKFVSPEILENYNIQNFDDFATTFGIVDPSLEFTATGNFKVADRFKSYVNVPELVKAFRSHTDVVLTSDVKEFKDDNKIPKLKDGQMTNVVIEKNEDLEDVMDILIKRLEEYNAMSGREKRKWSALPLVVFSRAKQAAIDLRLLNPSYEDNPNSKTNHVVRNVLKLYKESTSDKGTQLVFCDSYQSPGEAPKMDLFDYDPDVPRFNLYEDIKNKLIEGGIPANEIAIVNNYDGERRKQLFEKVRNGDVRVLLGSTEKMGVGVNVQDRLYALHHIDAPIRPMDFEQRNGRILRQGNLYAEWGKPVNVVTYGVQGTLDATAYDRLRIKQDFINQMMKGDVSGRVMEEQDEEDPSGMTFNQMAATLSGDKTAQLLFVAENDLKKLRNSKRSDFNSKSAMGMTIQSEERKLVGLNDRLELWGKATETVDKYFPDGVTDVKVNGNTFTEKFGASLDPIIESYEDAYSLNRGTAPLKLSLNNGNAEVIVHFDEGKMVYELYAGKEHVVESRQFNGGKGLISSIEHQLKSTKKNYEETKQKIAESKNKIKGLEKAMNAPWGREDELKEAEKKVADLKKKLEDQALENSKKKTTEQPKNEVEVESDEDVMYRTTYHGSGASFDKFDHSFMGTGEGTQVYGWGTYVTPSKRIAIDYANAAVSRQYKNDEQAQIEDDEIFWAIDRRNLYEVEIPDDNGENYIRFDVPIPKSQQKIIKEEFVKTDTYKKYAEKFGQELSEKRLDNWLAAEGGGGRAYKSLGNFFDDVEQPDKEVSKFLSSIGFTGMSVPTNFNNEYGDHSQLNYVIFNENDLKIVDHIRFRKGEGPLTADEVSLANDPLGKVLGQPTRTAGQRKSFAQRERQRMVERVTSLAKKLGLKNVEIVTDASTLSGAQRKAKGFYSKSKRKITIVIPNHSSVFDAEQTLLHEAVGHYGLRELFGNHFDTFLNNVYKNASSEVRERINRLAMKNGWDFQKATEEYLASLAEETNFEDMQESWWSKIKEYFLQMLHEIGFIGFRGVTLTDNELRYILWRSYENLAEPGRYRSILGEAADIAMQDKLKVGNYSQSKYERERLRLLASGLTNSSVAESAVPYTHKEQIEDLVEEFTSLYNSVPVHILDKNVSDKQLQEWTGMEDITTEELIDWMEKQKVPALHVRTNDNIIIFADKMKAEKVEKTLFHENLHKLFNHGAHKDLLDKFYESAKDDKNFSKWKDISDKYNESERHEEFFVYVISNKMKEGNLEDVLIHLSAEEQNELFDIINTIGYEYEQERHRRTSQAGRRGGRYSMRNSDVQRMGGRETQEKGSREENGANGAGQKGVEDDNLYRSVDEVEGMADDTARWLYEKSVKGNAYRFQEGFQDAMLSLKKLQEAIVKQVGGKLEEWEDAYTAENQMSSRDTSEIENFMFNHFKPMMDAVAKFLRRTGLTYEDLRTYLFAKSGLERNRDFAVRDAIAQREKDGDDVTGIYEAYLQRKQELLQDLKDGTITFREYCEEMDNEAMMIAPDLMGRDYSGLSSLFGEDTFTEDAISEVEQVENLTNTDALWNAIKGATQFSLDRAKQSGVMSTDVHKKLSEMFEWYIPMRGWSETKARDVYDYFGRQEGVFNPTIKNAYGRKSLADDPLATIANMAESSIFQGNKNQMKQKLLNLAFDKPTNLITVMDSWIENKGTEDDPRWEYVYPPIEQDDDADVIAAKIKQFEEEMEQKKDAGVAKKLRGKADIPYIATPKEIAEHIIRVKRNGREFVMIINGNPRAAQAINGETNPETYNGIIEQVSRRLNRFMAAAFTTKNPTFIMRNLSRDLIFSNTAVAIKESNAYGKKFRGNQMKVLGNMRGLMKRYQSGKLDMNNPLDKMFQEFIQNGGETGFAQLTSVDEYKNKIQRELKDAKNRGMKISGKKVGRVVMDTIEFYNRCAEDVSRFTVYMTSRQMGRSIQRSVSDAKEITVNFNKRGSGSKAGGFIGFGAQSMRSLYLFFNAAVQALVNFKRLGQKHPIAFTTALSMYAVSGFLMPVVNEFLSSVLGGDDDDYENLPEWVRRNNLVISLGKWGGDAMFLTVPLPIEMRAFYGLGETSNQLLAGNVRGKDAAIQIAGQFAEMLPLNFVTDAAGPFNAFTPDAFKPIAQAYVSNKDWTGKPIYRDNGFNKELPEWTKAYAGTSKWLVNSAELLNELTGGDKYKSGVVDINPARLEHLFTGYLGGFGDMFLGGYKTISMLWDEDYRNVRNTPVLKAFLNQSDERTSYYQVKKDYASFKDEYEDTVRRLNGYERELKQPETALEYAERMDFLQRSPQIKRYEVMKTYEKELNKLYKEMKEFPDPEVQKAITITINQIKSDAVTILREIK